MRFHFLKKWLILFRRTVQPAIVSSKSILQSSSLWLEKEMNVAGSGKDEQGRVRGQRQGQGRREGHEEVRKHRHPVRGEGRDAAGTQEGAGDPGGTERREGKAQGERGGGRRQGGSGQGGTVTWRMPSSL